MREDDAFRTFCEMRWPDTGGLPVCPRCGSLKSYFVRSRRRWVCANQKCRMNFTPTSGTVFAYLKLSYAKLLEAMEVIPASKTVVEAAQRLGIEFKTTYILARKLREFHERGLSGKSQHVGYWQRNTARAA